jgi:agmatine deiminase
MAWPCRQAAFEDRLDAARAAYAQVARSVAGFEPVAMLARPEHAARAADLCGPAVTVIPLEIDDSWTRDTGPTFVVDGRGGVAGVDWRFNGWGNVWPGHDNDALMAGRILDRLGMRRYAADLILEGGAIHVDGQGALMAVEPCLLDPARNPGLTRDELETLLSAFLGVSRFIWLDYGLENDETAGHVDNVACFARPGLVLAHSTPDPEDGNYLGCRENIARLRAARDASGRPLEVIELPQPARREGKDGRLALTYINFYLANGGVVMPSFDDPQDGPARDLMARVFPDRQIVQIPALDILYGGGGIHCITQQQPVGRPLDPIGQGSP